MTPDEIREAVRTVRVELDGPITKPAIGFYFGHDYADYWLHVFVDQENMDWCSYRSPSWPDQSRHTYGPLCLEEARAIRAALEALPPGEWKWYAAPYLCFRRIDRAGHGGWVCPITATWGGDILGEEHQYTDATPWLDAADCAYRHSLHLMPEYAPKPEGDIGNEE